ncbi:DUF3653 domain-containing protein [Pseudoxanthomonas mexicana]|uniref:DUF3653 domain-containing protein n=1 Tax=Pseudoxanthomonas mexicana TaxID=128785 RepID=UPI00398B7714
MPNASVHKKALDDLRRPPCWPEGIQCPSACASAFCERTIHNHTPLHGPWAGWRMAGKELVSPNGLRVTPQRLMGLAWRAGMIDLRESLMARKVRSKEVRQQSVKVVVVDLADWQARHFGRRAG